MKPSYLYIYTLLFCLMCSTSISSEVLGPAPLESNQSINLREHITLGEELSYIANWSGFPAGTVKTKVWNKYKVIDDKELFLFEGTIEANDFVSIFYSVKNTLRSYAEVETGFSRIFTRKVSEEDYTANDRVDYNYKHKNALGEVTPEITVSMIRGNNVEIGASRIIPGKISDPLGFAFLIRGLEFDKIGSRKSLLVGDRFATGIVTLTLDSEEIISIPSIGSFDCFVIIPKASTYDSNQNLLQIEGNAKIWIEKNTKIVLRAEAELPIGQASAVMTSFKNTQLENYIIPEKESDE